MCISDSQILAFDFACHQIPLAPALGGDTRGPANKLCCHVGFLHLVVFCFEGFKTMRHENTIGKDQSGPDFLQKQRWV